MLILCELCTGGTLIDLLERYNYKLAEKQIVFIMRHLLRYAVLCVTPTVG